MVGPKGGGVDLVVVPHQLEKGRVTTRMLGPECGWIVISHIGWRGKRNTLYNGVETFPYQMHFKALMRSSEGKAQRKQYLRSQPIKG